MRDCLSLGRKIKLADMIFGAKICLQACLFILEKLVSYYSSTKKFVAKFALVSSGFYTAALPIELSSQRGLVASLIQFNARNTAILLY